MDRNRGFSRKEDGVGGTVGVVPTAREAVGGDVGRKVRRLDFGFWGSLKMYW